MNKTELPSEVQPAMPGDDSALVLRTRGLSLSFGRVSAVDDLNLTVRAGEVFGFLGRNGAGKTTTIRMLMGIIRADRGTMELFGKLTRRTSLDQKRRIGYVSQGQFFYAWMTCRRLGRFVGGFYPTWDHTEYERLLRVLDVPYDRKVSALSGGTRVKLALALALAHRPEMLILDEPTAGLDPVARREFLDMIGRQARMHRRTTLFSSHLVDEVERVADRIGIIHRGRLCYEGPIAALCDTVREVRVEPPGPQPVMLAAAGPIADPPVLLTPGPPGQSEPVVRPNASSIDTAECGLEVPPTVPDGSFVVAASSLECGDLSPVFVEAGHQGGDLSPLLIEKGSQSGDQSPRIKATRQQLNELLATGVFRLVRERAADGDSAAVLSASPQAWSNHPFPPDSVRRLSLEDIFIAMASESIADL